MLNCVRSLVDNPANKGVRASWQNKCLLGTEKSFYIVEGARNWLVVVACR